MFSENKMHLIIYVNSQNILFGKKLHCKLERINVYYVLLLIGLGAWSVCAVTLDCRLSPVDLLFPLDCSWVQFYKC